MYLDILDIVRNSEGLLKASYQTNQSHFDETLRIIERDLDKQLVSPSDAQKLKELREQLIAHKQACMKPSFLGASTGII